MIWRLLAKDLRQLAIPVAVAAAGLGALSMLDAWRYDYESGTGETVLNVLLPFAWGALIALAVQLEPLTSANAFWLTRPYRRRDLLAAKLLFAVITVHLPLLLANIAVLLSHGFSPWQTQLLWVQGSVLLAVTIPSLAISSVTSSLAGFGWCALSLAATAVVVETVVRGDNYGPWIQRPWIPQALGVIIVGIGGTATTGVQYFRRARVAATILGLVTAAASMLTSALLPHDIAMGLECALQPKAAEHASLRFAPHFGVQPPRWSVRNDRADVFLPLQIHLTDSPNWVAADQLWLRVAPVNGQQPSWRFRAGRLRDSRAAVQVDPNTGRAWQWMSPDFSYLDAIGSTPIQVDGRAVLRPEHLGNAVVLSRSDGSVEAGTAGRCSSIYERSGFTRLPVLKVVCESADLNPPAASVTIVDRQTGTSWRHSLGDAANFHQFPAITWLSPLRRRQTHFQIDVEHDEAGNQSPWNQWIVPRRVLERSEVYIKPLVRDGCVDFTYSFQVPNIQEYRSTLLRSKDRSR